MPTKQQIAEQIAALEQPHESAETRAFYVDQLVAGFSKTILESKLVVAQAMPAAPPPSAPPESHQTVQDGAGGVGAAATGETPGTALEPHQSGGGVATRGTLPDEARWAQMERMAEFISKSALAPKHLAGKPKDTMMVLLVAHDLGISATQAMQKVAVIEGQPAMTAELMVALVLREGHRIWPDPDNNRTKATAHGQRREHDGGWSPVVSVSFTLDDAVAAGLCQVENGLAKSRSNNGKKLPWELYTPDLLWARAVSRLVRRTFADAGSGVTYVPEELGYIDADEVLGTNTASVENATITLGQQRSEIAARIANLPDDDRAVLRDEWKRRNLPKPDQLSPAAIRTALNLLEPIEHSVEEREKAATGEVQDAELVDDAAPAAAAQSPEDLVQGLVDAGLVTKGVPGTDDEATARAVPITTSDTDTSVGTDDDDVVEGELVDDGPEECAGGDGLATVERPMVYSEDGKAYHVDCAPFV